MHGILPLSLMAYFSSELIALLIRTYLDNLFLLRSRYIWFVLLSITRESLQQKQFKYLLRCPVRAIVLSLWRRTGANTTRICENAKIRCDSTILIMTLALYFCVLASYKCVLVSCYRLNQLRFGGTCSCVFLFYGVTFSWMKI